MRKIMRAHNRIIQPSLQYTTVLTSSQFQTVKNESPPQPLLPNLGAMTQQGRQDLTKILQDIGNEELHVKIV